MKSPGLQVTGHHYRVSLSSQQPVPVANTHVHVCVCVRECVLCCLDALEESLEKISSRSLNGLACVTINRRELAGMILPKGADDFVNFMTKAGFCVCFLIETLHRFVQEGVSHEDLQRLPLLMCLWHAGDVVRFVCRRTSCKSICFFAVFSAHVHAFDVSETRTLLLKYGIMWWYFSPGLKQHVRDISPQSIHGSAMMTSVVPVHSFVAEHPRANHDEGKSGDFSIPKPLT